ncbi:MAG: hypothetical protein JWR57_1015 [Mycetocola sp.]|nr:hypothetical protein [Mycetocola sp.]
MKRGGVFGRVGLVVAAVLVLVGCSSGDVGRASEPVATESAAVNIKANEIGTMQEGFVWARSLDSTVDAGELSAGIGAIGDLVPNEEIWFATNNEIGQALVRLRNEVLERPEKAGTKVDDLNAIADDIEEAIEWGVRPPAS